MPCFGPLGVLLRHQALETFRKDAMPILTAVGTGSGEVEVLLVFESFRGRAVQHRIGLPLVQLLDPLGYHDECGERRSDRGVESEAGYDRHYRADDELAELDLLVRPLSGHTLAVIPPELILQPFPCHPALRHR